MGSYILNKSKINPKFNKRFIVIDNFYENPDYIREIALKENFFEGGLGKGYMGNRTADYFFAPDMQEVFEKIIGNKINNWYQTWSKTSKIAKTYKDLIDTLDILPERIQGIFRKRSKIPIKKTSIF